MKRFVIKLGLQVLLAINVLILVGCGDSNQEFVATSTGASATLPPGTIINQGTGPVNSQQAATQRFLAQYIGLQSAAVRAQSVGSEDDLLVNAFIVPEGPFSNGTSVTDADDPDSVFVLDESYYLFWVDPNPVANLGHQCQIVYLRASDGLMVEQTVDFDPLVGGRRLLELPSAKAANLVYTHPTWRDLGYAPGEPAIPTQITVANQALGAPGGPRVGGLGVAGAPEDRRTADLAAGAALFTDIGGELVDFETLRDQEGDRKDAFDLEEALATASEGLGPDDKFLFVLSSHGSRNGEFCMGTDTVSWATLCELIDQNVTAGNVNLVIDTCFSGLAVAEFEKWDTPKRVRIITSTGDDTPSYSRSGGLGINLGCVIDDLRDRLDDAGEELTLEELEEAMLEVEVSQEELDRKLCELIGDVPGGQLSAKNRIWKDDYLDLPGSENKIDRTSPPKTGGFDKRPGNPEQIGTFLEDWSTTINSHPDFGFPIPFPELELFYPGGFLYNGQNVSEINRLGGGVRHDISVTEISDIGIDPETGEIIIQFFLTDLITVPGGNPVSQSESIEMEMELIPLDPVLPGQPQFQITTQRLISQTAQGTIGNAPPPLPAFPTLVDFSFQGMGGMLTEGDSVEVGELLSGQAVVTGLQGGTVGTVLGPQFTSFTPNGLNNFQVVFNVPVLEPDLFLITVFAENRNTQGGSESFSSVSRTFPVNVTSP